MWKQRQEKATEERCVFFHLGEGRERDKDWNRINSGPPVGCAKEIDNSIFFFFKYRSELKQTEV